MAEEKKYDSFGFQIGKKDQSQGGNSNFKKFLKIIAWILVVLLILVNIFASGLSGYLSFYEFQGDTTFMRVVKVILAIYLSWFYLGWKLFQKMGVM